MTARTRQKLLDAVYDLTCPVDARTFIEDLRRYEIPLATHVDLPDGRSIFFTKMSDADACKVAKILYDIVVEHAAGMEKS